ncbi:MAG: DUF2459 domain-containing protein [Bacteroidales bacterium]|nr:MAG: DUF2459 domain-containing protein [Bacteroidales bacterium]
MSGRILIPFFFLLCIGCATPRGNLYPPAPSQPDVEKIFIVRHTWHTGIIISKKTADQYLPAIRDDFPGVNYLEVGWGEKDFFTAEKGTVGLALKAVLIPTESVLHIMPFKNHPFWYFKEEDFIELTISEQGFINLAQYFSNSFALNSDSTSIKVRNNSNIGGQFYLSREKYHGFKTCNVWIARAIKETGFPIGTFFALTSGNVMSQVERKK